VVEMIATGLAFGIFVDAVVVRTLLVPALVAIMGRWNWWLPSLLGRALRVAPESTAPRPDTELISQ
jgi:RND superfamily putative drug exporter